jgi:hypothetical protein
VRRQVDASERLRNTDKKDVYARTHVPTRPPCQGHGAPASTFHVFNASTLSSSGPSARRKTEISQLCKRTNRRKNNVLFKAQIVKYFYHFYSEWPPQQVLPSVSDRALCEAENHANDVEQAQNHYMNTGKLEILQN